MARWIVLALAPAGRAFLPARGRAALPSVVRAEPVVLVEVPLHEHLVEQVEPKECKISAKYWRARSRLYQNEIFQGYLRLTAFFKLYKACILLHRSNLKILA